MIDYIIPLLGSYLDLEFLQYWALPLFALYFVLSVPGLLRAFTKWG